MMFPGSRSGLMSLTGVALNCEQEAGRTVLFWVIAGVQASFSAPAEQISDQSLGHSFIKQLPSYRKLEPTS